MTGSELPETFELACEVSWDVDALRRDCGGGLLDDRHVQTLVAVALFEAGDERGDRIETSVAFVAPDRIRELNDEHREIDAATDVLSFPVDEDGDAFGPRELGDVVICPEHTEDLNEAVVHGVLHLVGMDHETDAGEMLAVQAQIMEWMTP